MIEIRDLSKSFNGQAVLAGLVLSVRKNETLVIIGRSGTGKSVCLKHIVGLLRPDRGTVTVFGQDLSTLTRREMERVRLRIGYLFQSGALLNWMTIFENVALPLREHHPRLSRDEMRRRVEEKLDLVEMLDARDKYPSDVSGGMKKRGGLARAVILNPDIVLYDEPTSGLDPVGTSRINGIINKTRAAMEVTQVLVTHDMESAYAVADRIAMLHEGRIVAIGTPDEIRSSRDPVIRQFIEGTLEGPLTEGNPLE